MGFEVLVLKGAEFWSLSFRIAGRNAHFLHTGVCENVYLGDFYDLGFWRCFWECFWGLLRLWFWGAVFESKPESDSDKAETEENRPDEGIVLGEIDNSGNGGAGTN